MIDQKTDQWDNLPLWLKWCFRLEFFNARPARRPIKRVEIISHVTGFLFCLIGFRNEAALAGGLLMLINAYLFYFIIWQGDRFGVWFDAIDTTA